MPKPLYLDDDSPDTADEGFYLLRFCTAPPTLADDVMHRIASAEDAARALLPTERPTTLDDLLDCLEAA